MVLISRVRLRDFKPSLGYQSFVGLMYHVLTAAVGRTVVSPSIHKPRPHNRVKHPTSESNKGCCAIFNCGSLSLSSRLREYSTEGSHEWWCRIEACTTCALSGTADIKFGLRSSRARRHLRGDSEVLLYTHHVLATTSATCIHHWPIFAAKKSLKSTLVHLHWHQNRKHNEQPSTYFLVHRFPNIHNGIVKRVLRLRVGRAWWRTVWAVVTLRPRWSRSVEGRFNAAH